MVVTEVELVDIWRYFQYCCVPSIVVTKYAFQDYLGDIKKENVFYRHRTKFDINNIGKTIEKIPNKLMSVSSQNIRYINIFSDNIDEQLQDEVEELHRAIYITIRNAKESHAESLAAIYFITTMLQLAVATFKQCCADLKKVYHKDPTEVFKVYNLQGILDEWEKKVANKAVAELKCKKGVIDLNNPRCIKAIHKIRDKYSDIETIRTAMKKSYPWSVNYREDIPYEESVDYLIVKSN